MTMAANATSRWSDTFALRETTLSLTLTRVGKTAGELYRDVQDDYGSCHERRFYRVLKFLVDGGFVTFRREFHDELDQEVTLYFRARHPPGLHPVKRKYICSICGMLGAVTRCHPHDRAIRELRGLQPTYVDLASLTPRGASRRGPRIAMPGSQPAAR